jgi:beta-xylosidase
MLRVRFLCSLVLAGSGLCAAGQSTAKTFTNPVSAGGVPIPMGDPWAFRGNGAYYLVGTTAPHEGFEMYTSPDLAHWRKIGWVLRKQPGFWASDLFWAPEVHFYRGRYYMVYSGMLAGRQPAKLLLGLAVSDRPEGLYTSLHTPWFDPGYSAIDGDIFIDADGKPYLYFSRNGGHRYASGEIYGVALTDDLSKPIGAPRLMMKASQPWELQHPDFNRCNEGPTVFRHGGRYYMTYSANDTSMPDYGIGYATAGSPLGPWTKSEANPILKTIQGTGISGPGHNSIVASPNGKELWIVYHTHADPAHPSEDRIVNSDRITFDAAGAMHVTATRSPQPLPAGAGR